VAKAQRQKKKLDALLPSPSASPSAEPIVLAARWGGIMTLQEAVQKYLAQTGEYGKVAALSVFGLPKKETEQVLAVFDEDYHISRFFHLRNDSGERYDVNGFPQTHVSIDAEIATIL
jgi:hypothetical protein